MLTHKTCKQCKQKLEIHMFTASRNVKDGYENKCKVCRRNQRKKYELSCIICGKKFPSSQNDAKFCSSKCRSEAQKKRVEVPCIYCSKPVVRPVSQIKGREYVYCNQDCRTQHLKELMKGEGNPNYNRVKTNCGYCKEELKEIPYKVNNQKHIYCSDECFREHRRILMTGELNPNYVRITLSCEVCGKEFPRKPGAAKRSYKKYCSRKCYEKALTEYNHNRKAGDMYPCSVCSKPIYATKRRRKSSNYFYCSKECKDKGWSLYFSGPNHPNWKNDKSYEERVKERLLEGYKNWRTAVFERNKYTCQCCGDDKGGNLEAHHKNGWDKFHDQWFDVANGITLCKDCHKEFHLINGYGGNTEKQFNSWLSMKLQVN
jgi:endogenous inhibitor of DNA gyrase (YacG/DUF329 family)